MSRRGTHRCAGIMAIISHHHFRRGTVVGQKQDDSILQGLHFAQLVEDSTNLLIHAVHHRGMDSHLRGLKLLLFFGEVWPEHRNSDFAWSVLFDLFGEWVRWSQCSFHGAETSIREVERLLFGPSLFADFLPAFQILLLVLCNIFRQCLQRKMRRREGDVLEEGLCLMRLLMVFQTANGMICDRDGRIIAVTLLHGWQLPAVFSMAVGAKESSLVLQFIAAVKAAGLG